MVTSLHIWLISTLDLTYQGYSNFQPVAGYPSDQEYSRQQKNRSKERPMDKFFIAWLILTIDAENEGFCLFQPAVRHLYG